MSYLGIDLGTTNSVAVIYRDKDDSVCIQQQEGDQHHDPHHKKTGKDRNIPTVIPEGIPACTAFHTLVRFFHTPPHFQ